ncbi:Thyrotropin-releasing hormone receptor [Schistosoma japonicum]|uniref:Thyrotropin-releasing hormone receptor n=1 Tax=Schistosoma japonicum TaxID=6182 RepID=A0A4Z2DSE9_SCHJA|nr:Thyrotropin-releasing hormone receptor [Schistosoma japonicum]KAH8863678.1 Thyrotropin-releasing hormone receptor [Schistosoma japonicum]TNN19368.1 Thyrotropin-releasing hormone receptor [Schistosoma japonicum]
MDTNFTLSTINKNISLIPLIYYSLSYKLLGTISLTIILTVGVIGNILVMLVLTLTTKLHTPTNCYLVSLSASDLLVLMTSTTLMLQEFYQPYNHWILGNFTCQLSVCLQYLSVDASALSICAFSVERWVGICYPMRAHYMCTIKRAIKIITGIWIFTLTYNIPWIFMSTTVIQYSEYGSFYTCTFKFKRTAYKAIYMCDLLIFYVLPLFITSVMYCQISWRLFRTDNKGISLVGKHINFNQTISPDKKDRSYAIINESQQNLKLRKVISRVRARRQVVKLLMIIVILFASFWLPYRSMVVYNSFSLYGYHDLWFRMFSRIMAFLNSAVNPILYNAMSRKFRRALKRLLKCQKVI